MEDFYQGGIPEIETAGASSPAAYMPTMKDRINQAVRQAEARLAAAKEAQEIFARNPDLEKLINCLQRGGF